MTEAIQKADKRSSLAKRSMQKMLSNKLAMIGVIIVVIFILMSIFAPIITPHDPSKIDMAKLNQPPSSEHIFGTDSTGRDIFSRLLYGGSTGEGFLMSHEERKLLVEYVIEQVKGRIPVIVHVGSISTKLSIDLAKHAYEKGADAISSVPPFYWRFDNDSIFQYYKDISESTPLPMIVYNVPLAGLMGIDMIYKLAEIDNVKGIKYTATNHFEINLIKDKLGKDFMLYSGSDEMAVSGLLHGADGLIGSFYSMIPDIFENIYEAMEKEDIKEATLNQKVSVDIIMAALKYDYYAAIKLALSWMGLDAGRVRRPFKALTPSQEEAFRNDLIDIKNKYKDFECDLFKAL